jgi:hypothetical protein
MADNRSAREVVNPAGIRTIGDFPNLTAAMERAGWPEVENRAAQQLPA